MTKTLFRINKGINAREIEPRISFKKSYNNNNNNTLVGDRLHQLT